MSFQEPSHYAEEDMVLVAGSDYIRMASIGGGVLSIKLPTSSDSTPVVESIAEGGFLAVNGGTYVDAQRLGALYMRESGDGTTISNPNYVMMYNPNGNPLKEITYSDDIPNHLNIIDASLNIVDASFSIIDASLNIHDISLNTLDTQVTNLISQGGGGASYGSTIAIGSGSTATGTNSVAIGNNASTSTYDNSVALGNGSTSGADNTIILGDGTQNVGIGTTSPSSKLQITDGSCKIEQTGTNNNSLIINPNNHNYGVDIEVFQSDSPVTKKSLCLNPYGGSVGIGTTSPEHVLDVNGGIKVAGTGTLPGLTMDNVLYVQRSGNGVSYSSYDFHSFYSNSTSNAESGGERMRISSNGNVGIGTTNPLQKLHVESGNIIAYSNQHGVELAQHEIKMTRSGAAHWSLFNTGYFKITNTSNNNNAGTNGTDYFTMDTTGKVGIGSNVIPSMTLNVRGGSRFGATNAAHYTQFNHDQSWHMECYLSNSGHTFYINYYVQKTVYLNRTSYGSDIRIKENILDVDDESALNMIRNIQPKTYEYKVQKDRGRVYGFIAQQIKEVIPEAVTLHKLHAPFDSSEFQNVSIDEDIVTLSSSISIFEIGKVFEFKHLDSNELFQLTVTEIIDDLHFKIDLEGKGDRVPNNALLVGEGVDDFHLLDKNYIFTVATAALQEVDRQLQAEKAKTATLEAQMADVLARLSALENP